MENEKNFRTLSYIYYWWFLLFMGLCLSAYCYGYREDISCYKLVMQVFIGIFYWGSLLISTRVNNIGTSTFLVFVNMLVFSVILRIIFWDYADDLYDGITGDNRSYEMLAIKSVGITYKEFCMKVISRYNFDDLGFYSILYFLYDFFRDIDFVRNLMLIINALALAMSTYGMYKLSLLIGFDFETSNNIAVFYGLFPFWILFSVIGFKENIFCSLIVAALFSIYRYKENKTLVNLCLVILFIASTYLFRFAIALMLILLFVFTTMVNENNRKRILVLSFLGSIVFFICANVILVTFAGVSLDDVEATSSNRMSGSTGTGIFGWILQVLSALIGPFPNFLKTAGFGIYYSSGLLLKSLTSIFVLVGCVRIIKNLELYLYPILLYLIMGVAMLVISSVAFDMRYHITFFPAYVILLFYGFDKIKYYTSYILFTLVAVTIIVAYNLR